MMETDKTYKYVSNYGLDVDYEVRTWLTEKRCHRAI